jgi:uncharacterized protein (TIGR03118 family)
MSFLLGTRRQATKRKMVSGGRIRRGARSIRHSPFIPRFEALDDRIVPSAPGIPPLGAYVQTNLVSDIPGQALRTDPNLKNPWGTSFSADRSFSISNQKTNVSTLYAVTEAGVSAESPTVVIPTTAAGPQGPTGQVSNDTSSFLVNGRPASFIYADLNGNIYAWSSSVGTTAQREATTTGAAYTGLDLESTTSGDFLYAANPKQGRIDLFDGSFNRVTLPAGAFVDPQLPAGLVPFSVDNVTGDLYVMYAPAGPPTARSSAPLGAGAIAVFDTSGNFIKQLTSGGNLASPWGIVLAPPSFGQFGGDLLVGNFSYAAPEINAFDTVNGAYLGTLTDSKGTSLLSNAQGIWDMIFGIGDNGGVPTTLYFVTGLNAETDGLFGAITPAPRPGIAPGIVSGAGQDTASGFSDSAVSGIVIAGNAASGVGNYQAVTAQAVMTWSGPATWPDAQTLPTIGASPNQDAIDQLFATLGRSLDDAAWIV